MIVQCLCLILLAAAVQAQTNELTFTVLETAQGNYTNATITRHNPAFAYVIHNGGSEKISCGELPAELQRQFGYSPSNAATWILNQANATKVAKIKDAANAAARAKLLASLVGPVQTVRLIAIVDNFGQCVIATSNGSAQVYMVGLPGPAKNALLNYLDLKNRVENYSVTVKNMARTAERVSAAAPVAAAGSAEYVNAAMAEATRANNMILNAREAKEDLSDMKTRMEEMAMELPNATTFTAYSTGLKDNGIPRWQAAGQ
jgi:hypothetical protein